MARKVTAGAVGSPSLGAIQVASTANITSASNLDISISPVGTGRLLINSDAQMQSQNDLRFADADNSNWVAFQGPATVASNVTWTLPATDGSEGHALRTNGAGTLTWTAVGPAHSDEILSSSTYYPVISTLASGNLTSSAVSTTKLSFQPSTGILSSTQLRATDSTISSSASTGALVVTGGAGVGGNINAGGTIRANVPLYLNSNTINDNYTIDGSTNAVSAGPITIADGITVTVNGNWSVV
jgi:hypothetical protein